MFRLFVLFSFSFIVLSCSDRNDGLNESLNNPVPYCSQKTIYPDPIIITGKAEYQYRINGNGEVSGPNPIRHAEVRVVDSEGRIIQCGETNSEGNFSLKLPKDNSTVFVSVASRADNEVLKVYILKDPKTNVFHGLEKSVVLDSSKNMGSFLAPATGSLEGGAFNILDKILDTNNFLREKTQNCEEKFSGCIAFTVAPLTTVYWDKGVDPNKYLGSQKGLGFYSGESFYISEKNQIYLLGGEDGKVDDFDTDHFDDSVIIHEYGHFIEKFYSNLASPNGPHNGDDIIDPRLAFSEAWADFLQAQVRRNPCYRDTSGTVEGTPLVLIEKDMEDGDSICGSSQSSSSRTDVATVEGEGNFREFAIARALVDLFDEENEGEGIDQLTAPFAEFWTLFTSKTVGIANEDFYFNNVGRLLLLQSRLYEEKNENENWNDWSEIIEAEKLRSDLKDFGNSLESGGTCESIKIQAKDVPGRDGPRREDGSFMNSNLFDSNDFYEYRHQETGPFKLTLKYEEHNQGESPPSLDLFLYSDNYVFGRKYDMLGSNQGVSNGGEKTLRISHLEKGVYMINVMVYTGMVDGNNNPNKYNPVDYEILLQEQKVCPK